MYLAADEQVLSKDRQLYVLDRLKQKLRQGNFDAGIESAVVDIGLGLSGADMPDDTDSGWDWGLGVIGLIFGGFLCNSCWWVCDAKSEVAKDALQLDVQMGVPDGFVLSGPSALNACCMSADLELCNQISPLLCHGVIIQFPDASLQMLSIREHQPLYHFSKGEIAEYLHSQVMCPASVWHSCDCKEIRYPSWQDDKSCACLLTLVGAAADTVSGAPFCTFKHVIVTSASCVCRSGFRRSREATACRSLLQKLKDEQASAVRNQQYPAASCPICFEDLAKPDPSASSPSASSAARVANAYKDSQSDCDHGAGSSKSELPSAPPLDGRSEYETLLDKGKAHGSTDQDEQTRSRCVQNVSPVFVYVAMLTHCHLSMNCHEACGLPWKLHIWPLAGDFCQCLVAVQETLPL